MTVIIRHLEQNILQSTRNVTEKSEKSKKIPNQVRNDSSYTSLRGANEMSDEVIQ